MTEELLEGGQTPSQTETIARNISVDNISSSDIYKSVENLGNTVDSETDENDSPIKKKTVDPDENIEKLRNDPTIRLIFKKGVYDHYHLENKEAGDQYLCNYIADSISTDPDIIDNYFRQSAMYSEEWESIEYKAKLIKNAITYAMTGGNHEEYFNSEKCYEKLKQVKPSPVMSTRIQQALEFIKFQMCSKKCNLTDITAIEMFIEEHVFVYFDIGSGKNNKTGGIFRRGYNAIITAKKKEIEAANKNEYVFSNLRIDKKYDGMYTSIVTNDVTGEKRIKIIPHADQIARMILNERYIITYEDAVFMYSNGYYKADTKAVETIAMNIVSDICKGESSDGTERKKIDVMNHIKAKTRVYEYPFNRHKNAIPVRNGVVIIDLETYQIRLESNPSPDEWMFDYVLDVDYDEKVDSTEIVNVLQAYLYDNNPHGVTVNHRFGRYDYRIFTQILAQGILESMDYGPYKSSYCFVGKTDSGKTTVIDILGWFIGKNGYSIEGLEGLTSENRFSVAGLEGKTLNLCDDVGYFKMNETGRFKTLTGRHMHTIEHKGIDKYIGFIYAVHVVSTNNPAGFDRRIYNDSAFWGRWYYVKFPNSFIQDGEFKNRVFTEANKSALLNEVILMIIDILKNHWLIVEKEDWQTVREKWMQESNPLSMFIEDNMIPGGQTPILKNELFNALRAFCEDTKRTDLLPHGYKALGELVELCGGLPDVQRDFENSFNPMLPDKKHCYLLDYTFKCCNKYSEQYIKTKHFTRQADITSKKFAYSKD